MTANSKKIAKPRPKTAAKQRVLQLEDICERFVPQRGRRGLGETKILTSTHISYSLPAGCTHLEIIKKVASLCNLRIDDLPDILQTKKFPRGDGCFDLAYKRIDMVANSYEGLYWNVSKAGIKMFYPATPIAFDRFSDFVGNLMLKNWDGPRLRKGALLEIATAIDASELFSLKDEVPKATWNQIAAWNQKHPRSPVKTFEAFCKHRDFRRVFQKQSYRARDKFKSFHLLK